jgi:type I restriction enzyme, S subunit
MSEVITSNLDLWTSALLIKPTAGRGSNENQSVYGIKKLRELILELAVRGKLVPQDTGDEPASALLKTIAQEQLRLIEEGAIRKENSLSEIAEVDKPFHIPDSWEWAKLTDLYYSISPSGKKLKTSEIVDEGKYPVVDQGQSYIAGYTNDSDLLIDIPGPVVVFGDHTTEIKYVDFDFVAGADGTKILRPYFMDERYFYTFLKSYKLENRGYARHFKVLNENLFALPPLAEQHRIVAKVDELMALCDQLEQQQTNSIEAHHTLVETLLGTLARAASPQELREAWNRVATHFDILFTTGESIDRLKQTILQLAVKGKLISQDPRDEPASVLLDKIAREKKGLVEEGRIKAQKPLLEIGDDERPHTLPESWAWVRFGNIAQHNSGKTLDRGRNTGQLREYITTSNLYWGRFDLDDIRQMPIEDDEVEKCTARKGDLLICEGGEAGRAAVWSHDKDICFQNHIHRARFYCDIDPYFAYRFFEKLSVTGEIDQYRKGVGISNMSSKALASIVVPLPPLAEQHRIVAKVDELMALCDGVKAGIADAQTTQVQLADAIVAQAVA